MSGNAPLVILPGLTCSPAFFAETLAAFPGALAIGDYYGGADSLEGMADYALALMPERAVVVGHSMGGRVALEVWRKAPERVAGLALCDTGVNAVAAEERAKRYRVRDHGRAHGFEALIDLWLPPMIGPQLRDDPAFYGQVKAICLQAGQKVFEAQTEALLNRPEEESLLPGITCPVAAITAEDDEWSPPADHAAMAQAVPDGTLTVVPGVGHMLPVEDPAAFNAALAELLARV